MSFLGGGGGSPPQAPPFKKLNVADIANKALTTDQAWYKSLQFPVFPGMGDIRQAEIEDAYKQLTSPLSPEYQSTFVKSALNKSSVTTGGGDPFSGMALQKGSAARGGVSADVTRSTLAKQDYDRARFESLESANPIPGLGLSQQDLLGMYTYNTNASNANAMQRFSQGVAGANSAFQNQANMWNTVGSAVSSIGNIYGNYNMYVNNPGNYPIDPGVASGGF